MRHLPKCHINTCTFCKKNNGTVSNTATWFFPAFKSLLPLPLLWRSLYWAFSFLEYTPQLLYWKALSFIFRKNLKKKKNTPPPKNLPYKPTNCHRDLIHNRQTARERSLLQEGANPVISLPAFSVMPPARPAPLLPCRHVACFQPHFKPQHFVIKETILS